MKMIDFNPLDYTAGKKEYNVQVAWMIGCFYLAALIRFRVS